MNRTVQSASGSCTPCIIETSAMSVAVGAKFPVGVEVETSHGPVSISQLLSKGPVIVGFHRMWCPFCQQAARDLVAVSDRLAAINATVVDANEFAVGRKANVALKCIRPLRDSPLICGQSVLWGSGTGASVRYYLRPSHPHILSTLTPTRRRARPVPQ